MCDNQNQGCGETKSEASISQILVNQINFLAKHNNENWYKLDNPEIHQKVIVNCGTIISLVDTLIAMHDRGINTCLKP